MRIFFGVGIFLVFLAYGVHNLPDALDSKDHEVNKAAYWFIGSVIAMVLVAALSRVPGAHFGDGIGAVLIAPVVIVAGGAFIVTTMFLGFGNWKDCSSPDVKVDCPSQVR
ncbi:hypothetical protein [Nocardioides marmorisolisilvae]|uniref:Uncharacterized protein n=1 Tax=Nocardioides marmorisolisilvae TaxID=1542737 RepID=A0A3N0DTD7_9ACTN|nr:hypothetical protein [Nocardioides marmorisolisilvae]RNL78904.1 hypothetical protein EFL95_07560 [Nocardioides marmorisolisilvae]